ncbi:MAG: hypothetical protein M1167_04240 [Chloroflexi bacterium]|nr:hypothetical protein [Chloroflexota bacterium]
MKSGNKEVKKTEEEMHKVYDCYKYLLSTTQDVNFRDKIVQLGIEHGEVMKKQLASKIESFSENIITEFENDLKKLKKRV